MRCRTCAKINVCFKKKFKQKIERKKNKKGRIQVRMSFVHTKLEMMIRSASLEASSIILILEAAGATGAFLATAFLTVEVPVLDTLPRPPEVLLERALRGPRGLVAIISSRDLSRLADIFFENINRERRGLKKWIKSSKWLIL